MLNLKNNENYARIRWNLKKKGDLNKISENEEYFYGQHSLVGKSPPPTDRYIKSYKIYKLKKIVQSNM